MRNIFLELLTYGVLISFCNGAALIGKNARDARTNEFLFVVALALKNPPWNLSVQDRQFCTGALISEKSVLTAGHCLVGVDMTNVEIIAGSADLRSGQKYYPLSWRTYDQWRFGAKVIRNSINDIAIITLRCMGVEGTNIRPAKVLRFPFTNLYKSKVRIAGWGESEDHTKPAILKTGVLTFLPKDVCVANMTSLLRRSFEVSYNYICSVAKPAWLLSSCGDSGAPVFTKRNQIVAINIGACPDGPEFAHSDKVNTHLSVFNYRYFIEEFTKYSCKIS